METIFKVSVENALTFAEALIENNLLGTIVDVDDDEQIHIEVSHTRQDRDSIEQLAEITEAED